MVFLMSDFHEGIIAGVIIVLFVGALIHFAGQKDEDDYSDWRG